VRHFRYFMHTIWVSVVDTHKCANNHRPFRQLVDRYDDNADIYSTVQANTNYASNLASETQKLKLKSPSIRKSKRAPRCRYHKDEPTSQKKRENKKSKDKTKHGRTV
jgi:hypothetical protein